MVVAHLIRFVNNKTWALFVFGAVFLSLGVCLIHTYSRGGILAAVFGQLAFWGAFTGAKFTKPARREFLCGAILFAVLSIYALLPQVNAASRYTQGLLPGDEDRSISNRLRIWKDAPRMMTDAPRGWGIGRAGIAWMQWYQPVSTRYQYRTLVNSHLTWMVEFGWFGRFVYLFAWGLLFAIVFDRSTEGDRVKSRASAAIATGIWFSFAVSMFFSSIAESWVLWVLPLGSLLWMIFFGCFLRTESDVLTRGGRDIAVIAVVSFVSLVSLALMGYAVKPDIPIHCDGENVILGIRLPRNLLLQPDERVLGQHYGIQLRENLSSGWLIADSLAENTVPEGIELMVLSGDFFDLDEINNFQGDVVILNSLRMLEKSGHARSNRVILGSHRKDAIAKSIRHACAEDGFGWDLELRKGKKLYLGNWMEIINPPENQ
ncbi:MAG: O-antigen ligase family protein [Verrucomicrobiota bacterium]